MQYKSPLVTSRFYTQTIPELKTTKSLSDLSLLSPKTIVDEKTLSGVVSLLRAKSFHHLAVTAERLVIRSGAFGDNHLEINCDRAYYTLTQRLYELGKDIPSCEERAFIYLHVYNTIKPVFFETNNSYFSFDLTGGGS